MKFHTSLPVNSILETEKFYSALFESSPIKQKENYLKYLPEHFDLNISFVESKNFHDSLHLGIEVKSLEELEKIHARLNRANLLETSKRGREDSTCCYARQDKFWVKDPSGYEWEIYTLIEDKEEFSSSDSSCC